MRPRNTIVVTAALLAAACSNSGSNAPVGPLGETRQELHGPIPNVLVRLLNAPGGDWVVCNPTVRGLAPSPTGAYRTTITLTYPSAAIAQKVGTVTLSSPFFVNNTDGKFSMALVESPAGSGEYTVKAELKRKTTERTAGIHRCEVQIEEDADGDTVFETEWLNALGEARHVLALPGPSRPSTSHRVSNGHVICQSRMNVPNPSATYYLDVSASTSGGSGFLPVVLSPGSPAIGPLPLAGGTVIVEWGLSPVGPPQPTVDVRFDFVGQQLGSASTCRAMIMEGIGFLVHDGETLMVEQAPTCGPAAACGVDDGCCPSGCLYTTDADCSCGNGAVDFGEPCDDGNGVNLDGCENDCTLSPDLTGTWSGVTEQGQPISFTVANNSVTSFAWQFYNGIEACGYVYETLPQPIPILPGGTFDTSYQEFCGDPCSFMGLPPCPAYANLAFSGSFASGTNASGTVGGLGVCCSNDATLTWTASRQ